MKIIKILDIYNEIRYIPLDNISGISPYTTEEGANCAILVNDAIYLVKDNFDQFKAKLEKVGVKIDIMDLT